MAVLSNSFLGPGRPATSGGIRSQEMIHARELRDPGWRLRLPRLPRELENLLVHTKK